MSFFQEDPKIVAFSGQGRDLIFTSHGVYLMGFLAEPRQAVMIHKEMAVAVAHKILEVYGDTYQGPG